MPVIIEWPRPDFQQIPFFIQCADFEMILQVREANIDGGSQSRSQESTKVNIIYLSFMMALQIPLEVNARQIELTTSAWLKW
jgi:hypothetical protein